MNQRDFLTIQQKRIARIATVPSVARNQGAPGVLGSARHYLETLHCGRLAASSAQSYLAALDAVTDELMAVLPQGGRSWGIARKIVNIFIREALYNTYLTNHHQLGSSERFMEVPLDSFSARGIKSHYPRRLPVWPGMKGLQRPLSDLLQEHAAEIGEAKDVARIHLDALWWSVREE